MKFIWYIFVPAALGVIAWALEKFLKSFGSKKQAKIVSQTTAKDLGISPKDTMENKQLKLGTLFAIAIILAAIISGMFYWYSYRPSAIRKECSKQLNSEFGFKDSFSAGKYQACLVTNGLEK